MKRKLAIFQYGSQLDARHPTRFSPSDWVEISLSESSPSEKSCSMDAPQASNSYASDASSLSIGDDPLGTIFNDICSQFEHWMATTGKSLPSQWSLPEFSRAVIGEEEVQDLSYLQDILFDLVEHGSQSWYVEGASQLLIRSNSSVMG